MDASVFSGDGVLEVGSGPWLVEERQRLDAGEAAWLDALARFDAEERWRADGQCSCVDWLCTYATMGRATAYDKLRVARELRHRPVVADAFARGDVSWCAVRAITRATGTVADTDEALVRLARSATVADVEAAVRTYGYYASQEAPPRERGVPTRGLRIRPIGDGLWRVEAVVTNTEAAELEAVLDGIMASSAEPQAPSSCEEPLSSREALSSAAALSSREEAPAPGATSEARHDEVGPTAPAPWVERRLDALLDLVRGGIGSWASGGDRYLVHVVLRAGQATLLGGAPLPPGERDRIACDAAVVAHLHDGGVPLAVGRRTRSWSTGQRRAVLVRDGGRCRWPGCRHTRVDVHHVRPWSAGGATDVANGIALCPRHHTLLHEGFVTCGSADGRLEFFRPDTASIGSSTTAGPLVPA